VGNVIDVFLKAAEAKNANGMIFNIGSGVTFPLKHYVELIIKEIEIDAKINYGALEDRKNDLWNPQVNVDKVHSIINWYPEISLEDGINRTISWYRKNYHYYDVRGR